MNEIITAITTVGFPIVMVLIVCWFVKYIYDTQNTTITRLTTVIEDNTKAIEKLIDQLQ